MGRDVLPDPLNVNVVSPDPLPVFGEDYFTEVQAGNVPGKRIVLVTGRNLDVDMGGIESVWSGGGLATFSAVGEQYTVVSTDAADDLVGTGAQQIRLEYLDTDYVEQFEIIELDGLTPVLTTATNILRFREAFVVAVGSSMFNAGDISFTGSALRGKATALANRSLHGLFTVPAGETGQVIWGYATIGKNKDAQISIEFTLGDAGVFYSGIPFDLYQNSLIVSPAAPVVMLPEKSDINPICETENNNTKIALLYQVLLTEN